MLTITCDTPKCKTKISGDQANISSGIETDSHGLSISIIGAERVFVIKDDAHICHECLNSIQEKLTAVLLDNPSIEVVAL